MARKPNATREFRTTGAKRPGNAKNGKRTQTSVAYRTARIARARQKREIEQQKREKMIFALFVVVVLVMIIVAILVFKKVLGNEQEGVGQDNKSQNADIPVTQTVTDPVLISEDAVHKGNLLIVDAENAYSSAPQSLKLISDSRTPFTDGNGKTVYSYYVAKRFEDKLEENTLNAFNQLADAFYNATKSKSNDLFVKKSYVNGTTVYGMGTALDLEMWKSGSDYFALSDSRYATEYEWLKNNCHKYGFIITEDTDKMFSIRFVGVPHAVYMNNADMSLEQYVLYLESNEINVNTESGDSYRIFYVKVNGEYTEIPISRDSDYTLSGNNSDGIIVTVKNK